MKTMLKYFATFYLVAMIGVAVAQSTETDRLTNAVYELVELKEMNKSSMTKAEKKAWKARKRALKKIIAIEQDKLEAEHMATGPWRYRRYGSPYYSGVYSGIYPGYGYSRFYRPRSRVVVVNPDPYCEVPVKVQRQRTRTQQRATQRRATQPRQPVSPRTPSRNRRR